jgi:hypothetical protein
MRKRIINGANTLEESSYVRVLSVCTLSENLVHCESMSTPGCRTGPARVKIYLFNTTSQFRNSFFCVVDQYRL